MAIYKKSLLAALIICLAVYIASARDMKETVTETVNGTIIDNMCATTQNPATLDSFVARHTKGCALMPQCAASGYSIYSMGRLMKFDGPSNVEIEEFLREGGSLNVTVEAAAGAEGLSLVSIKDRE